MLGEIALEQWRCIGELVDNSIDGFLHASRRGEEVAEQCVQVLLPEADREDAIVQVTDNGPGMAHENLERAVKAGWSGNNPTDNLGLFGMGFNIATARLGSTTEVWTTRKGDPEWRGLAIDFDSLQRQGSFKTPVLIAPKPDPEVSGTKIVIRRLKPAQRQWLAKSANQASIRKRLSQAYAAMLRAGGHPIEFKLYLNNRIVQSRPFCVWGEDRSTDLPDLGEVFAIQAFNYPLGDRYHCAACMNWVAVMETDPSKCPICDAENSLQRRQRRVHGWVGLQRYADTVDFGIDIIRNGRKIELSSKELFVWRGENGDEPEYPIDDPSRRGRFVGEIHVDHCRVNFAKERFDRSDPAWEEMVTLIRGEGPLRPEKARELGYSANTSPLYKLYKAFRRLRPHSSVVGGWRRLLAVPDNSIAKELAQKFYSGHPDYQDDSHWWRLIEEAERRQLTGADTTNTVSQPQDDELPEDLLGDSEEQPAPQADGASAAAETDARALRRETPSLSRTYVYEPTGLTFTVRAFECSANEPDIPEGAAWSLLMAEVATRTYYFLYKPSSPVFNSITLEPLDALLFELAILTFEYLRNSPNPVSYATILQQYRRSYAQGTSLDARMIALDATDALKTLADAMVANSSAGERAKLFDALTPDQQSEVMRALARKGIAPATPIADGTFLSSAPASALNQVLEAYPELVFDGGFWDTEYAALDYGDPQLTERAKSRVIERAQSLVTDASWLAEADPINLATVQKQELVRSLMSLQLLRPDKEVL
jgi:hypothetical protein